MCPGPVLTEMLGDIFKGEEKLAISDLVIPKAEPYASGAIKTLGFTYHTTGNLKHALMYHLGLMGTSSWLSYQGNKRIVLKQKLKKNE